MNRSDRHSTSTVLLVRFVRGLAVFAMDPANSTTGPATSPATRLDSGSVRWCDDVDDAASAIYWKLLWSSATARRRASNVATGQIVFWWSTETDAVLEPEQRSMSFLPAEGPLERLVPGSDAETTSSRGLQPNVRYENLSKYYCCWS